MPYNVNTVYATKDYCLIVGSAAEMVYGYHSSRVAMCTGYGIWLPSMLYGISVPRIVIDFSITSISNYILLIGRAPSVVMLLVIYGLS